MNKEQQKKLSILSVSIHLLRFCSLMVIYASQKINYIHINWCYVAAGIAAFKGKCIKIDKQNAIYNTNYFMIIHSTTNNEIKFCIGIVSPVKLNFHKFSIILLNLENKNWTV